MMRVFASTQGEGWDVILVEGPCVHDDISEHVRNDSCGAVIVFSGVIRNNNDNMEAVAVEYDMQKDIALKTLSNLAKEICETHSCRMFVMHSRGRVLVGEASVIIASASAHRRAAFKASEELIDRLKKEVPIWKKEIGPDQSERWLDGSSIRRD